MYIYLSIVCLFCIVIVVYIIKNKLDNDTNFDVNEYGDSKKLHG